MMGNSWVVNSFVVVSTNEGRVNSMINSRVTVIDIEPITINISSFKANFFTDGSSVTSNIIGTEFIGWFLGSFPRFEEER
jgi:hypothetical protein